MRKRALLPISLHRGELGDEVLEHAAHVLTALRGGQHRVHFGKQGRWGDMGDMGRQRGTGRDSERW